MVFPLIRELRLKNLEIWRYSENGKSEFYIIIIDLGQPSQAKDYPYLKELEQIEDTRENHIKTFVLSNQEFSFEQKQKITSVIQNLLGHIAESKCNWNVLFQVEKNIDQSKIDILKEHRFPGAFEPERFSFFSQDVSN